MKKQSICLLLVFLISFILGGCGAKEKSISEIQADLQNHPQFFDKQEVTITDIEMIKRQTDKKEKTDMVFATVKAGNEGIDCTLSYSMQYGLYDSGWILDSVFPYSDGEWQVIPKRGPMQEAVDAYIAETYGEGYSCANASVDLKMGNSIFSYEEIQIYSLAKRYSELVSYWQFNAEEAEWISNDSEWKAWYEWDGLEGTWVAYQMEKDNSFDPFEERYEVEYRLDITDVNQEEFHAVLYRDGEMVFDENVAFKDTGRDASFQPGFYGAPIVVVDLYGIRFLISEQVFEKIS